MGALEKPSFQWMGNAASLGRIKYLDAYIDSFDRIEQHFNSPTLRTACVRCADKSTLIETAQLAALLNDISFLRFDFSSEHSAIWFGPSYLQKVIGAREIIISFDPEFWQELQEAVEEERLSFAVLMNADTDPILRELCPLIERGNVLVQPHRVLAFRLPEKRPVPGVPTKTVTFRWPIGCSWYVNFRQDAERMTIIDTGGRDQGEKVLSELVIPFIRGLATADLVKLLEDEADIIYEFRSGIRELARTSLKDAGSATEVLNDVVGPRIARLDRRFKQISSMYSLRIGGAIASSATLALTSYLTSGIPSALAAIVGGTGLAYLSKELASEYAERNTLREDPTYLLWRLKTMQDRSN